MNKTIKIMAALLPLFITSCTNDDANVTTVPQQEQAVTISAGITRTGETGTTNTEDFSYNTIKVINITRQAKGLPYSQAVFTKNSSETTTWASEGQLLWCAGETNTFRAVYPANANYSSFTVPTDQSDATKIAYADWMTCEISKDCPLSANTTPDGISFLLKRKNAKVVISSLTILRANLTRLVFNTVDNLEITPYRNGDAYEAIIQSGGTGGNTFATISINAGGATFPVYLKIPESLTSGFEAGKKYTFTATFTYLGPSAAPRSAPRDNLTLVSVEPM